MRFGDSIRKLLETYGNCLQLLEVFRRRTDETRPESDAASLLQKSLKSDRDKIERRYASRLSESGRRLARGDDKAKSVLRRTLKKLNAALVDLLHMGKHDDAMLPYDALKRLSNSSRIDAVNAIDQLSHRLASAPSRRSLASSSGVVSSSTSADGHRRRRASASDAGTSIAPHSPPKPPPTKTRKDPGKRSSRKVSKEAVAASKKAHRSSEPKRDSRKLSKSVTSSSTATAPGGGSTGSSSGFTDSHAVDGRNNSTATDGGTGAAATNTAATTTVPTGVSDAHDPTVSNGSNRDSTRTGTGASPRINISTSSDHGDDKKRDRKPDLEDPFPLRPRSPFRSHRFSRSVANRMSMMTVSSVSTKLGEIPERRRLQRVHGSSAAESGSGEGSEYNVPPTYPLKPYRTPPGSRAKNSGFWGLFSRR